VNRAGGDEPDGPVMLAEAVRHAHHAHHLSDAGGVIRAFLLG
jgi:hypothetical protein